MMDSRNAGTGTRCGYPGCGQPIEVARPTFTGGDPFWTHAHGVPVPAVGWHRATPGTPPEPAPVRMQCPGLGCRASAWRMPDGNIYCTAISGVIPPNSVDPRKCGTCGTPEDQWDTTHRLHLPGSRQCPGCRQTDIHEDVTQDRREEG